MIRKYQIMYRWGVPETGELGNTHLVEKRVNLTHCRRGARGLLCYVLGDENRACPHLGRKGFNNSWAAAIKRKIL